MKTFMTPPASRLWAAPLLALVLTLLSACSSGPSKPQPMPLTEVTALVPARLVWSAQVGPTHALLSPVAQGSRLFVANAAGAVLAFDARTGGQLWRLDLGNRLAAGVGSDGETVAVVTETNDLVAMAAGSERWRVRLGARTFTPPLVAGQRVFVLAGDRTVSAFDARSGAQLWSQAPRSVDPLVLQQAGVLTAIGDTLVAGVSGRLTGFDPLTGAVRWEAPVATPRGVTEIERLVDLVGHAGRVDNQLCVRAYLSAVGCVDASRGAVQWTRPASGSVGVDADADYVFGTEGNGRVQAWRRAGGEVAWSSDRLLRRGLTAPLAAGRSVVLGDAFGYVHLLSRVDGGLLNRLATDGSPIAATPMLAGNTLVVLTRNGGLYAWRPE